MVLRNVLKMRLHHHIELVEQYKKAKAEYAFLGRHVKRPPAKPRLSLGMRNAEVKRVVIEARKLARDLLRKHLQEKEKRDELTKKPSFVDIEDFKPF
jgi:hypothetical protein